MRASIFLLATSLVAAPLAAQESLPLTEEQAQAVREACGFPQTDIIDASGFDSFDQLDQALADRGVPQIVYGGAFRGADFAALAPRLARTCFHSVDLEGSTWTGARISGLVFVRASMNGAMMAGADLPAVRFEGVDLSQADLEGASLQGGHWIGAYWKSSLESSTLRGARLADFTFTCSIVMSNACGTQGTDFSQADFTGADLSSLPVWGQDDFSGARFDRSVLDPRALAHFGDDVDFAGPVFFFLTTDEDPAQREVEEFSPPEIAEIRRHIGAGTAADRPSFDCAKASTPSEVLICGEWHGELRAADRLLAETYAMARDSGLAGAPEQRTWLRRRDACGEFECMEAAYRERIGVLLGRLGPPADFRPGETRLYTEEVLALDPAFRAAPLYRRLVDPLRASTHQEVALTMRADRSIDAEGSAIGGNAHLCSLEVEGARFDPSNGWYSATGEDGTRVPLFRLAGNRLEFRYSGNFGDTPEAAADYISCGARAGFSTLVDLTR